METFVGIAKERVGRVTFVVTLILVALAMTAQGQVLTNTTITLDGSTGVNGTVNDVVPNQIDILDTWGVRRGTNVFHSFSNFDVAAGDTANFTVTGFDPTNRIFARIVSPGGASLIEGTVMASNPNATPGTLDLYLINPDGIMFSSGAVVNVSGSFLAATATSLTFDGGGFFRTDNLNDITLSLLSSSFLKAS